MPILSPCIGVCQMDSSGYCVGCYRTGQELTDWIRMSPEDRDHCMNVVLPAREAEVAENKRRQSEKVSPSDD